MAKRKRGKKKNKKKEEREREREREREEGREGEEEKEAEKRRGVAKRNRVLADSSRIMKFIRAFVSAFGFTLRKKGGRDRRQTDRERERERGGGRGEGSGSTQSEMHRRELMSSRPTPMIAACVCRFATRCNQPVQQWYR
jgi:hypothetical protein